RVVARAPFSTARLRARTAGADGRAVLPVLVARPLPDVADHVVEPVPVGRERADGRGPLEAVQGEVLDRELALPRVRHEAPAREELVAPGVGRAVAPAARGELPFGLGGQVLAGPARVRQRVFVGDVHDGMVAETFDRAVRAER